MKVFYDFEFIEGTQDKTFLGINYGKTKFLLEPISVGMVKETGETFYEVFNDFNLKEAWNRYDLKPDINNGGMKKVYWIRENVLKPIWKEYLKNQNTFEKTHFWNLTSKFCYKTMKLIIKWIGKSKEQVAKEIVEFLELENNSVELWANYADYDHVCLAQCFGKMINLPKGIPFYTKDIQQLIDSKSWEYRGVSYEGKDLKRLPNYPKQTNEHNAKNDAIFNKELYEFLQTLK